MSEISQFEFEWEKLFSLYLDFFTFIKLINLAYKSIYQFSREFVSLTLSVRNSSLMNHWMNWEIWAKFLNLNLNERNFFFISWFFYLYQIDKFGIHENLSVFKRIYQFNFECENFEFNESLNELRNLSEISQFEFKWEKYFCLYLDFLTFIKLINLANKRIIRF